jgi:FMN phosphatase YigB (HAD superfamily)
VTPLTGPATPPEPSFETLVQLAQAKHRNRQVNAHIPLTGAELCAAFERELDDAKVISFDVFDTLLLRRVAHPVDVFLHLDQQPAFVRHRFTRPVAELRIEAEKRARQRLFDEHKTGEVELPEIYSAFCELAHLLHEVAHELVEAEETLELLLCRPNPRLQTLFQRARATGKPIIALSDTYHRHVFLVRLLEAIGTPLPAESVFASSHWRINKQSGQLFGAVFDHLRLLPGDLLHIGDHPISDYRVPRQLGVRTLAHGHHGSGQPATPGSAADARLRSVVRSYGAYAACVPSTPGGFWWELGHNTFGPLMTGFALWLAKRFREDRIDRAYFLLRDGEIFHRTFEALFPPSADLPHCQRLPSSRRAYVFPILKIAPEFVLPNLMVCSEARPVGEFLERLDIPAIEFEAEFRACGFQSVAELLDARRAGQRLKTLLERPRIQNALQRVSEHEYECLVGYLRQQGVLTAGRVALIDLGWHGTIHKAVQKLVNARQSGPQITGYYLAQFPNFRRFVPEHLRAGSYLGGPEENERIRGIASLSQLLEIVCSSASGSLRRFVRSGTAFVPILQPNPVSEEQIEALSAIHEGIVSFAREYHAMPEALRAGELPPALAVEEYLRLVRSPTKEEAMRIGHLVHGDDFGTDRVRGLAQFRSGAWTPETLWEDYERAYWKPGMLNQATPQGNALRTLWWLLQP